MRQAASLGKSVLFLREDEELGFGRQTVINVWWRGRGGNADLMPLPSPSPLTTTPPLPNPPTIP